jgi:acyl carrier protein
MAAPTKEEILKIIKQHLADNVDDMDEAKFDPAKSMKAMGANSLDIVEVVSCTMRDLKVKVPRAELAKLNNVNELVDLLHKAANEKVQGA